MTVIAWDGRSVATDTQGNMHGVRVSTKKHKISDSGDVLCFTGSQAQGIELVDWYLNGAKREDWPESQKTDDWSRLIVFKRDGQVIHFEKTPTPMPVVEPYFAWGSGMDFAIGAMAMGADAEKAVRVAIAHCVSCGGAVNFIPLP